MLSKKTENCYLAFQETLKHLHKSIDLSRRKHYFQLHFTNIKCQTTFHRIIAHIIQSNFMYIIN
jgi:hypothetical protein